jgi:hypothetical protein
MSSDDFVDVEKSIKIGELYPVLKDKFGNIIDGNHRLKVDPNWKTQVIPEIDTPEKLVISKMHANWNRRQLTYQEKEEWINTLAEIYQKEGYKALITSNEIVTKIKEATGLSQPTINKYLHNEFKVFTDKDRIRKPEISASERIENELGKEMVERVKQEVKEEIIENQMSDEFFLDQTLEKKCNEIINNPNGEDLRQAVSDLAKQFEVMPEEIEEKIADIQGSKDMCQPALLNMFVAKGDEVVGCICKPLERFSNINVSALNDLDSEQKAKVLATLLESQNKICEWITQLQGTIKTN